MANLIIGVTGIIILALLVRYLFSREVNRSDESIVLASGWASGWKDVSILRKTTEIHSFSLEKISKVFIVGYIDESGAPRQSRCRVTAGVATWEN